jgi:uncharacterized protein YndB with AHSA1/START domain
MGTSTDRIEKSVVLRASRERVWLAISDSKQCGTWFGVQFDGPFVAGKSIVGKMVPTSVDAEVAKRQEPYKGYRFEFAVDRVEPMRLFSFRWHPFAMDSTVDYSDETPTLVAFVLEEVQDGTKLTVTESGFDQIPIERRAKAFAANQGGWAAQMKLVEKYLAMHAKA